MNGLFVRGFLGLLPLWTGAIPAGIAYGVAARGAGLSIWESQLMSLVVFSAAGQIGAVALLDASAPALVVIGTVMALNAQLLLLGLTVGRTLCLSWVERLAAAWLLTDGAFGVSVALGPLRLPTLLGAGASMYLAWNVGTGLGAALGAAIPDARALGIDLVAPLCFVAVLAPLLKTRVMLAVGLVAGVTTLLVIQVAPGGVAVLGAGLAGCLAGAWWTRADCSCAQDTSGRPSPAGTGMRASPPSRSASDGCARSEAGS